VLSRSTMPTRQERALLPGTKNSGEDHPKHDRGRVGLAGIEPATEGL